MSRPRARRQTRPSRSRSQRRCAATPVAHAAHRTRSSPHTQLTAHAAQRTCSSAPRREPHTDRRTPGTDGRTPPRVRTPTKTSAKPDLQSALGDTGSTDSLVYPMLRADLGLAAVGAVLLRTPGPEGRGSGVGRGRAAEHPRRQHQQHYGWLPRRGTRVPAHRLARRARRRKPPRQRRVQLCVQSSAQRPSYGRQGLPGIRRGGP